MMATLPLSLSDHRPTVQGRSAEEVTDDDTAYESVACLACTQVHLINPKTGKVLGVTEY
jgi:hypothetical protein